MANETPGIESPAKPKRPHTGGRPEHVPTDKDRRMVETMVAYNTPREDIAEVLGISQPTLRKHYRQELDSSKAKMDFKLRGRLYKMAFGEIEGVDFNIQSRMLIFLAKTRLGMSERTENAYIGKDGKPADPPAPVTVVIKGDDTRL